MDVDQYMQELGIAARAASHVVAASPPAVRNRALLAMHDALDGARAALAQANAVDMEQGRAKALDAPLLDRLELTPARIDAMLEGLRQVAALPDPVGSISEMRSMESGIQVGRMRVPLGVIGIIYESRPNVTVEAASLCLKSGNAAILRGGSECLASNTAIAQCLTQGLQVRRIARRCGAGCGRGRPGGSGAANYDAPVCGCDYSPGRQGSYRTHQSGR